MGIDPCYHQKIFGLFEKLNPKSEGTGVGLAIGQADCRSARRAHLGRIAGEEKGSTLCFTLPHNKEAMYKEDEKMQSEPVVILLVEDNPDHTELIRRSLQKHRVAATLHHVPMVKRHWTICFGVATLRLPTRQKCPRPDVVLLDLRLPKVDGLEVLKAIKTDEDLRRIPVVILTSSEADRDLMKAYENYVNSYLVKPLDFDKFTQLMKDLGFYWLGWNRHPKS